METDTIVSETWQAPIVGQIIILKNFREEGTIRHAVLMIGLVLGSDILFSNGSDFASVILL